MDPMVTPPTGIAPIIVQQHAMALRTYEQVKMFLLIAVLIINIAIGAYVIAIGSANRKSLVILRCAVARSTQVDEHGRERTPAATRAAFETCVRKAS